MAFAKAGVTSSIVRKAVLVLAALIVIDAAGAGAWIGLGQTETTTGAEIFVRLVAPAFFLFALWMLERVMTRIERGERFSAEVARQVSLIGAGLMLGGWAAILFEPAMLYLMANGWSHLSGVVLDWSVQNIVLCMLGFFMLLMARTGASLQKTLDSFV